MQSRNKLVIEKVLLINLPEEGACADSYTPSYAIGSFSVYPPLGLLYVATAIKEYYPVEILDVVAKKLSIEQIINQIIIKKPTVLGISCQTFRLYAMSEIIIGVKKRLPNLVVVVGGPHTAIYPVETLNLFGVDFVIRGDGEHPFRVLLDSLSSGEMEILKTQNGVVLKDENGKVIMNQPNYQSIDEITIPDRELLDYKYYYTAADSNEAVVTMISSRGCPYKCVFCDVQDKKYRARKANDVVNEIEYLVKLFKNPVIHIFDDNFNIDKKRVFEICDEIKKRGLKFKWTTRAGVNPLDEQMIIAMKEAGLKRIHLGVESGSNETLRRIGKNIKKEQVVKVFELCKKHKIDTLAYLMIGFDWETSKEINETIRFAGSIFPDYIMANTLCPVPNTIVYDELLKNGKFSRDYWKEYAIKPVKNFILPAYQDHKRRRYLVRKLDEIYLTFYLSPKFIWNNLKNSSDRKQKNKEKKDDAQLLFKIKLASLILKSYIINLTLEKLKIPIVQGAQNKKIMT